MNGITVAFVAAVGVYVFDYTTCKRSIFPDCLAIRVPLQKALISRYTSNHLQRSDNFEM